MVFVPRINTERMSSEDVEKVNKLVNEIFWISIIGIVLILFVVIFSILIGLN